MRQRSRGEAGSTLPLMLGFFVLSLLVTCGAVAAGDAFVQQRGLQAVCDGAATAAAAGSADLGRGVDLGSGEAVSFAGVEGSVQAYLARDPDRRDVRTSVELSPDGRTIALTCAETRSLALGQAVGRGQLRHVVHSTARAPLRGVG